MTVLQGALASGAPAPGSGGEQIRMIWARTRPWPAQFLCAPNRRSGVTLRPGFVTHRDRRCSTLGGK